MTSREKILEAVRQNQPTLTPLPAVDFAGAEQDNASIYADTFTAIGGTALQVPDMNAVIAALETNFATGARMVTTLPELADVMEMYSADADPHSYENVEVAVIKAHLAVAENGAVWLTESAMGQRIIPFICQHLVVLVDATSIVPTMHEAYARIGQGDYGFGVFIGGPSKTADIEQALVLGAHGPIAMTVFILVSP